MIFSQAAAPFLAVFLAVFLLLAVFPFLLEGLPRIPGARHLFSYNHKHFVIILSTKSVILQYETIVFLTGFSAFPPFSTPIFAFFLSFFLPCASNNRPKFTKHSRKLHEK